MAESHRLGDLQVGESWHHGAGVLICQLNDASLQTGQLGVDAVECGTQIETQVGSDLIVARSPRVKLFTHVAYQLGESRLDIHVHILTGNRPLKGTLLYFGQDIGETLLDRGIFVRGEDACRHQHLGMGPGAPDVVDSELAVKGL